jgi:hypothetical protein
MVHLSLAVKVVVINSILAFSSWFFASVWVGSKKAIKNCRTNVHKYFWVGREKYTIIKINWKDCYSKCDVE